MFPNHFETAYENDYKLDRLLPFHRHGDGYDDQRENSHRYLHLDRSAPDFDYYSYNYSRDKEKKQAVKYDRDDEEVFYYNMPLIPDDFNPKVEAFNMWEPIWH